MTADRDAYKSRYYVVHKYPRHRHGRLQKCERCGVKRRYRTSDWEWLHRDGRWRVTNPPCATKKVKES